MTDFKAIEDAWLDIDVKESELFIPTSMLSPNSNDFHLQLAYLLMQPEYIPFLAKEVLGIQLLPFQSLVLQEMWARKFPMLIASRGAGKSFILSIYSILRAILFPGRKIVIVGAAFRQSKVLFEYMETIWNNSSLLRDMFPGQDNGPRKDTDRCLLQLGDSKIICLPLGDGCLSGDTLITTDTGIRYIDGEFSSEEKVIIERKLNIYCEDSIVFSDEAYCNGLADTVKITTGKGFIIEGTLNHKVLSKETMVELQNLKIGDAINIDCSVKWPSSCSFVDSHEAYCLGLLIGDGNYTDKYHIGFATKDIELIDSLQKSRLFNNNWKQMSDIVHYKIFGKDTVSNFLNYWEIDKTYTKDKYIPNKILSADKVAMSSFISGLFDTDGHVQVSRKDGGYGITVGFTNTSETLVKQLQYILTHYGIVAKVTKRDRNVNWNIVYELHITGKDTITFAKEIGFKLSRKQDILTDAISKKKKASSRNRIDNYYFDTVKSIEYGKAITYDMHVPETHLYSANGFVVHNTKIRGQRANDIIADEFASIPRDIFETVVSGFGVVKPNTIESVKKEASKKKAKELGIVLTEDKHVEFVKDNQIIFSGTAYYDFNHFASYWKKWRAIINSNGDKSKLQEVFAGADPPKDFDWRHYSIIRIPYELLPDGFMDASQVARSKATVHSGIYAMEFGAVFSRDSQGFFKRSLIESCVTGYDKNILDNNGEPIIFEAALMGDYGKQYVFGVDPASEVDNFSIVIVEIAPECRKIVYCWTTTRSDHIEKVKRGQVKEKDFYSYCARKIRDLMKLFPCVRIAMDAQGGGIAVMEALHDSSKLSEHEQPIWPVINPDKEQPWDGERGLHILEMCQFANYEWYSEANHGMRKDFEDKVLLFPFFDTVTLGISNAEDGIKGRTYDTLEDCVMEIEELKNELSIIQMTQTPSGRDRWDTPEIIVAAGKKSKMRKDRYSALLMANMVGRIFSRIPTKEEYQFFGGFAYMPEKTKPDRTEDYYRGPAWFVDNMKDVYDIYE
jgi:hypothetical protein